MITRSYKCTVLTPIIMAGADQNKAELRASSIKGLLRWWYRSLHPTDNFAELRKKESIVFGGVFGSEQRRSQVKLWLQDARELKTSSVDSYTGASEKSVKYLLYGAGINDSNPVRKAITPDQSFTISLRYPKYLDKTIHTVMSVMLTYGGMGFKGKNGFGQLFSKEAPLLNIPSKEGTSQYPHFRNWDKFEIGKTYEEAYRAHADICDLYYKSKNPIQTDRSQDLQFLSSAEDKNLFAGHTPHNFGLERKAKPVQLYVRRENDQYRAGMLAFPYQMPETKSRAPRNHPDVVRQFMSNVRHNNGNR